MDFVKKGRGAGIQVILATQKSTTDAVPSAIRDQCGIRICFRVMTRDAVESALGVLPEGATSPIGQDRGVGIASCPELGWVRFRAPYVAPDLLANTLRAHRSLTADPGFASKSIS